MKTTHTLPPTRHLLRSCAQAAAFALATLGPSAALPAALPYAGVYSGTYLGTNDQGNLAVFVDGTGWAGLLKLNYAWNGGGYQEGLRVATNGWLRGMSANGTVTTGVIVGTNLDGSYGGAGSYGGLAATSRPTTGAQAAAVGYYAGSYIGNYGSGAMRAILAADGVLYGWMDYPGSGEAFTGACDAENQFAATSLQGISLTGSVDTVTFAISGNWSWGWQNGSLTLERTHSMLGATCAYGLDISSTNLGSASMTAGFKVTTANDCP
jgi:hypothetical protein